MEPYPRLSAQRLVLRPFDLSDAIDVQRLAGDLAIADTTLSIPHPYEDRMAEEWISTHQPKFEAGEQVHFAIVLRETSSLIGTIGFIRILKEFHRAELGYWIGKSYWNKGYCTEAGHAVLKYGFIDLSLNRIHARHFKRNPASGRVMQKLGMILEGIARQHARKWDRFEDVVLYGILKSEWQEVTS